MSCSAGVGHPDRTQRADRIDFSRKWSAVGIGQIERSDSLGDAHQTSWPTVRKYVEQSSIRHVETHIHSEALSRRGVDRLERSASGCGVLFAVRRDRKSTRLNSSHLGISYAVFCLKK